MAGAARFSLFSSSRRFFAASSRRLAKAHSPSRRGQAKPLDYAPHQAQKQSDVYPNPDSLSPANPYGGAGAGPHTQYNSTARRITLAMVAAPIAIVTSYVLWQRLVLGQQQKKLVHADSTSRPTTISGLGDDSIGKARAEAATQTGPHGSG